jgi:hypothetical protein
MIDLVNSEEVFMRCEEVSLSLFIERGRDMDSQPARQTDRQSVSLFIERGRDMDSQPASQPDRQSARASESESGVYTCVVRPMTATLFR